MKFNNKEATLFIPDGKDSETAIHNTTHMAIAAHQDDIEIMAYDGILKGFNNQNNHFFGVVVTNGSGSARESVYKDYTDEQMVMIRNQEQKKAAVIGEFCALGLLNYKSSTIKDKNDLTSVEDIKTLLEKATPEILYTHNLADKHDTHIGVTTKVIKALRQMDKKNRPKKVYGCEVWRDLDWMMDDEKVMFDVSAHPNIAASLVEVFDSQIIGGKRYDLGAMGRRLANATFSTSHAVDQASAVTYAMDLTPLIENDDLDVNTYVTDYIERFKQDVASKINRMM